MGQRTPFQVAGEVCGELRSRNCGWLDSVSHLLFVFCYISSCPLRRPRAFSIGSFKVGNNMDTYIA